MRDIRARVRVFLGNEGNRRLTFVCSLTVAISCITPFSSSYFAARAERIAAHQTAQQLDQLQTTVAEIDQERATENLEVSNLRSMTISEQEVESFRSEIVNIVRQSDCSLRNITLGDRIQRQWMGDDDALSDGSDNFNAEFEPEPTSYSLQTQTIELVVTGGFENIRSLLQLIQDIDRLLYTLSLDVSSGADSGIRLRWELAMTNLVYTPVEEDN